MTPGGSQASMTGAGRLERSLGVAGSCWDLEVLLTAPQLSTALESLCFSLTPPPVYATTPSACTLAAVS